MATLDQIKLLFQESNAKMDKNAAAVDDGFKSLREEMKEFKEDVKKTVEESLKHTNERVELLECKLKEKDAEILSLQRDLELHKRKNNLVIFGLQEDRNDELCLAATVANLFQKVTSVIFGPNDFNDVFRLGKRNEKCRPIVVSLLSYTKLRAVLGKKHLFKQQNITVSPDIPKDVMQERKRLQPMITALNNTGTRASLRLDEVFVNGKKLSKEEVEEEMQKFRTSSKRSRSPNDEPDAERRGVPKLNINAAAYAPTTQTPRGTEDSTSKTPASSTECSTPSRVFPVFQLPQTAKNGVLSPVPGGSKFSQVYEYRSDKDK